MPSKYTKEKLWKLYKELPEEIKDIVFSEKTADSIYTVCEKNDIDDVSKLMEYVQNVLLGLLAPDDFQEAIETELKIEKEIAKRVTTEIYRYVFYPVKASLEKLYRIEIAPLAQMKVTPPSSERPPEAPKKEDVYREPIKEEGEEESV